MTAPHRSAKPETREQAERRAFARDVIDGLSGPTKSIPPRWFYDAEGSRLFDEITALPEYYLTRTEVDILLGIADELMADVPQGAVLVEFGSGSSSKTELLLAAGASKLAAYVPIDVSPDALAGAATRLADRCPNLRVEPLVADFTTLDRLPPEADAPFRLGFFPGSTIGNFDHHEAVALLKRFRHLLGPGGRLIIGVDLNKDPAILERAYDDSQGVTARFNLNLLHRINRELGANIDVSTFRHMARWHHNRIEMHLVSTIAQTIEILGRRFRFHLNETIHTENSWKYPIAGFHFSAMQAGWTPRRTWTDAAQLFSVHELI